MRDFKNNNQGFSLIELIVVIAILAVMSTGAVAGFGYLNLANTAKCASKIDSGITVLKSKNMSSADSTYMHLYNYNGNYYMRYSDSDSYTPTSSDYDQGELIANRQVKVTFDDVTIGDGDCKTFGIRRKDGAFVSTATPTSVIKVTGTEGSSPHLITLVTSTGKHFRDK